MESGATTEADFYVLAANPFSMADVLSRTPALEGLEQLRLFKPLVGDGPHVQVSLRIAFSEPMKWPRKRAAIVVASSEFDLTLFAEDQVWDKEVSLGTDVRSLWTVTACVSKIRGKLHGKTLEQCTKEQFIEEAEIVRIEVWHEWQFSPDGVQGRQPKWVNRVGNQAFLPTQATPVPNLVLAGAHTRTDVDVWSIEAAVESGRRAAKVFEPGVKVLGQYHPRWLSLLHALDNFLYRLDAPNVLDVTALAVFATLVVCLAWLCCR
jgi:hypothetical protein